MKQVTINGREYNIGYNLNTAIAYERLTGNSALDMAQFQTGKVENLLTLSYCMLISTNDPATVPEMSEVLASVQTVQAMNDYIQVVNSALNEFFLPQAGDTASKESKTQQTKGNRPKNA